MTIPESQLQTWANQGSVDLAQKTHLSLRNALNAYQKWAPGVIYDMYLQGSYRNSTNIRGDSDVDLVVELTSAYYSNLTEAEKSFLKLESADYNWIRFRTDAISALTEYYGTQYVDTSGKKSIKVLPNSGRLKADVVVAATYCHYENMRTRAAGMTFWTFPNWQQVINYPKLHYENGANKNSNQRARGWYKPTIRIYKNARNRIIENRFDLRDRFPSYFAECLLYNVPDSKFGGTYQASYVETLGWLNDELFSDRSSHFMCQNGMSCLFGDSSIHWNISNAREYVTQLIELWNKW